MDNEEQNPGVLGPVKAPRIIFRAKLDDRGRIKLSTPIFEYFKKMGITEIFLTSVDRRIALLYPMAMWDENEKMLTGNTKNPGESRIVLFNAHDLGEETELDSQGRVTVNAHLRRELELEGELCLQVVNGRVEIYPAKIYEERKAAALKQAPAALDVLERDGFR